MREVRGFSRPTIQWAFVILAIGLSVLVISLSTAVSRLNGSIRELRAERLNDRAEREQLQARLAREQATREALGLELARVREGQPSPASNQGPPTLTLQPLSRREATPPAPTMKAPAPAQTVELRLLLPPTADRGGSSYEITVRDWMSGQVRLTRGGLKAVPTGRAQAVSAYVTGDVFAAGSYEVILKNGQSEIATYEIAVK